MHIPPLAGRMGRRWFCVVALAMALVGCGGGGGGAAPSPVPAVGQVFDSSLTSTNNGALYAIKVYVPESYKTGTATYPVIYATEGDAPYGAPINGSSTPTSRFDAFKQSMQARGTQAILVGIGGTNRRNDDFLLPTATRYLDFIVKELAPVIESQYRANPQKRALSGLSHGGYFVMAALFTEAKAGTLHFSHYLSTEASTGGAATSQDLYLFEQSVFDAGKPMPTSLLLAAGAANGATNQALVAGLYTRMVAHNYSGLALVKSEFNTTHVGADLPAFEDALGRYFP